jgi:hypothetical protein
MAILLDTGVVSELRRSQPSPDVLEWYRSVPADDLYVSVLAIGEIRQGIERLRRRGDERVDELERWLATLMSAYGDRIVPITAEVADRWGRLAAAESLPAVDALMAATALVHDWTMATRNVRHVERTGVRWVNPFEPA